MTNNSNSNGALLKRGFDVFCFSHLRWDFVFQRPQHLMTRFARNGRVFFIEEPVAHDGKSHIDISSRGENLFVCVPRLSEGESERMPELVGKLRAQYASGKYISWFYTPMMLEWGSQLDPSAVVYDCMDELSAFKNAPPELMERERDLFRKADLVFTGGNSLYGAKKEQHHSVYAFPSSIETDHFSRALQISEERPEHAGIGRPRIGFIGVIDERTDVELLDRIAELRPDWNFVMVGPVVKISEEDLPRRQNIFYLGQKSYADLPAILAGWDAAMMPFALNESTRYISPTKTPEYLAAGLPVVSTPIADVIEPYGNLGLVHIASTPAEFVEALQRAMDEDAAERRNAAAEFLSRNSWDKTFRDMSDLIIAAIEKNIVTGAAEAAA
jgi:glycosyltransferase involved in cell wall biosynthesis